MRLSHLLCLLVLAVVTSCVNANKTKDQPLNVVWPKQFGDPLIPDDNQLTAIRIELGRRLFYDPGLSDNGEISCGSCHVLSAAFTDGRTLSTGIHGKTGRRNAPTLQNLAWAPHLMFEGGVPNLEMQILAPPQDSMEMGHGMLMNLEQLAKQKEVYNELSRAAYGRNLDVFVATRSIASFERTFVSADSRFDQFYYFNLKDRLNEMEKKGMELFFSKDLHCAECHREPLFTDFGFYNIGLYEHYADPGKARETYLPVDSGKFKTPSLRNIGVTAPYMHDGSLTDLRAVVEFYNSGGKNHPSKDPRIHALHLSDEQQTHLVAFLYTLTDWNFLQNRNLLPLEE
jgi:cytochrome c peroxidase